MFWPTLVTHMSRQTAARLLQGLLGFLSLDYWLGYSANVRRLVLVKQSQNLNAAVLPFMQVLDFLQQRRTSRPDHTINFINGVLILRSKLAHPKHLVVRWARVSIHVENESRMPRLFHRVTMYPASSLLISVGDPQLLRGCGVPKIRT